MIILCHYWEILLNFLKRFTIEFDGELEDEYLTDYKYKLKIIVQI